MKFALFSTLPLIFAINAHATSLAPVYHELACKSVSSGIDHGTTVNVDYLPTTKSYRLTITEQTIMGPRVSTDLARKLLSKMIGGPVVYSGQKFTVSTNATVSPSADGSRRGTLTNVKTGMKQELRCQFVR